MPSKRELRRRLHALAEHYGQALDLLDRTSDALGEAAGQLGVDNGQREAVQTTVRGGKGFVGLLIKDVPDPRPPSDLRVAP